MLVGALRGRERVVLVDAAAAIARVDEEPFGGARHVDGERSAEVEAPSRQVRPPSRVVFSASYPTMTAPRVRLVHATATAPAPATSSVCRDAPSDQTTSRSAVLNATRPTLSKTSKVGVSRCISMSPPR